MSSNTGGTNAASSGFCVTIVGLLSKRPKTPTITAQLSEVPLLQPNGVATPLTSLQRVLRVTAGPDSSVGSLQTQVIVTTGHNQELVLPVFLSVIAPAGH